MKASGSSRAELQDVPMTEHLRDRIAQEKAQISSTLEMLRAKIAGEMADVGQALSNYALPLCGAAALVGWWLAPRRRRPVATLILESAAEAPVQRDGHDLVGTLAILAAGGLLAAGAVQFSRGLLGKSVPRARRRTICPVEDNFARSSGFSETTPEPLG